ncbi:MAG: hypothetical protein WC635_05440 [Bacteriovorax sp.]
MKKLLICLSLLSISVSSMANDKVYKCESSSEINGVLIKDATISFSKGFRDSISKADLVVRSEVGVLLETSFRSLRIAERTKNVVMDGTNNSRINPFGDAEYLILAGLREKIDFDELAPALALKYESISGPVGNRGGSSFLLECSLEN